MSITFIAFNLTQNSLCCMYKDSLFREVRVVCHELISEVLYRTNSSFAQVLRYNSGELQWPGSSPSSDLQSTISMPPVRSSVDSDGKLEEFNMKMDFISMDSPISLPSSTTLPELGFKKQSYSAVNSGKLEPGEQLQPLRQSISPVDKNAPLQEAKVLCALALLLCSVPEMF